MGLAALLIPAGRFEIDDEPIALPPLCAPADSSPEPDAFAFEFPAGNLLESLTAFQDRILGLEADLETSKKNGAKDDEFARFARQSINFIDGLDRILHMSRSREQTEEVRTWLASVQAVYERILRLFGNFGLEVLDDTGGEVDLSRHDVVEYRRTNDYAHNTVIEVMQKGIMFRGRMLRDARVIVACNEGPGAAAESNIE